MPGEPDVHDGTTRLVIADDDQAFRELVRRAFDLAPDFEVVGEAANGVQAEKVARAQRPDVLLIDIKMPERDGLSALKRLRAPDWPLSTVVMTAFDSSDHLVEALELGISGFVLKGSHATDLLESVRTAARGGLALDTRIAARLADNFVATELRSRAATTRIADLPQREQRVLALVGKGCTNTTIAQKLSLSEATVKSYVSRIMAKIGSNNRVELALLAHESGLAQRVQ